MFRVARTLYAVSPFSMFLMDQRSNPELKGISIAQRGRMLSKMYKALSAKDRKALESRARAQVPKRKKSKAPKKTEFAVFVKQNYNKVKGLHYSRRFAALSQLYELKKPIEVDVERLMREYENPEKAKKEVMSAKKRVKSAAKGKKSSA